MKRLLPNRTELAILGAMAVLGAAVVAGGGVAHDLMASAIAVPTFIVAAIMGLRRSPQWAGDESDTSAE